MLYEFKASDNNKLASSIDPAAEEFEKLEVEYWRVAETVLKVGYTMTDIIYNKCFDKYQVNYLS